MTGRPVNPGEESGATSLGLLERAAGNDPAAWERVARLYGPLVEHWCRQAGLPEAAVEDVRQDVFLAVTKSIGEFRRDRPGDTFRGWLRRITQNKVRDFWRQAPAGQQPTGGSDAYRRLQQVADGDPDDDTAASGEVGQLLRRALDLIRTDFEERTWRAFWLVVVEGRPSADVAAELGLTLNAVYLARGRVLARLREEFGGLIES
ncbi:MAG: RNA polymerase sigma factor [Gemmataceae bacterium]